MTWICPHCNYRINGGAHFEDGHEHECDPRSVVRAQAGHLVSQDAAAELDAWVNPPWKGPR